MITTVLWYLMRCHLLLRRERRSGWIAFCRPSCQDGWMSCNLAKRISPDMEGSSIHQSLWSFSICYQQLQSQLPIIRYIWRLIYCAMITKARTKYRNIQNVFLLLLHFCRETFAVLVDRSVLFHSNIDIYITLQYTKHADILDCVKLSHFFLWLWYLRVQTIDLFRHNNRLVPTLQLTCSDITIDLFRHNNWFVPT